MAQPAVLVSKWCELRFDASRGWQIRSPVATTTATGSSVAACVGELCGVLSESLPKVYGTGGPYQWPLRSDQMTADSSAPTTIEVKGVGRCQTRTFTGAIATTVAATPPPLDDQSSVPADGGTVPARLSVQFALAEGDSVSPLFLWRVSAHGLQEGVRLDYIELLNGALQVGGAADKHSPGELAAQRRVYVNGWQSWTFSGTLKCAERQPQAWPKKLNSAFHNKLTGGAIEKSQARGTKYRNDMFTCVSEHPQWAHTDIAKTEKTSRTYPARSGVLLGWLSQRENFGVVRLDKTGGSQLVTMVAECDGQLIAPVTTANDGKENASFLTDWAVAHMMHRDTGGVGIETYVDAVGVHLNARAPTNPPAAPVTSPCIAADEKQVVAPTTAPAIDKVVADIAPGSGARAHFADTGGVPVGK
jgi:hypothetical protein